MSAPMAPKRLADLRPLGTQFRAVGELIAEIDRMRRDLGRTTVERDASLARLRIVDAARAWAEAGGERMTADRDALAARLAAVEALVTQSEADDTAGVFTTDLRAALNGGAASPSCGHGADVRCEDCGCCDDCPGARCVPCSVCRCSCECAQGEPAGTPAAILASQLVGADGLVGVTEDGPTAITVQVRPRDLAGWDYWLDRFQVPVHTQTNRGPVTTGRGTAPGGVTVALVGHGIAALQTAKLPHISRRGGAT